jgi:hypothetical protein
VHQQKDEKNNTGNSIKVPVHKGKTPPEVLQEEEAHRDNRIISLQEEESHRHNKNPSNPISLQT